MRRRVSVRAGPGSWRDINLRKIHQLLPDLVYGDAISNYAIEMKGYLRGHGYASDIFASRCYDARVTHEARIFKPDLIEENDAILYHHSIGSEITPFVIEHTGPKCLIYHNITPARFFEPYRPDFAKKLAEGRSNLGEMATRFAVCAGDSAYNASELKEWGFVNPFVLPIPVSPNKWSGSPDSGLMNRLGDGKTNILFVGRIVPSKCLHDLVAAFSEYLSMDLDARLIIVGEYLPDDPYYSHLVHTIQRHGLTDQVTLAGKVSDGELEACYRSADLFWSMSEHEGFCVPVIEAMWFDVPVLAYRSSAIPETLGESGIMFTEKGDLSSVAALARLLVRDEELRQVVLRAQRNRRSDFLPAAVWPRLDDLIQRMEEEFASRGL